MSDFDPNYTPGYVPSTAAGRNPYKEQIEIELLQAQVVETRLHTDEREKGLIFVDRKLEQLAREDPYYHYRGMVDSSGLSVVRQVIDFWQAHREIGPFTLGLTSPGGDVFTGFAIYDAIAGAVDSGLDITVEVQGYAASMASGILQAGKTRTMTAGSWLMIHEASTVRDAVAQVADLRDQLHFLDRIQSQCMSYYIDRSLVTAAQIETETHKRDWWLNAQESLDFGLVDKIINQSKRSPGV